MSDRSATRARWRPPATVIALAAMFIALIAFVLSMGGSADARGKELLTTATGSLSNTDAGELELTDSTLTQKAGQTILAVIKLDWDGDPPGLVGDVPCSFAGGVEVAGGFFVEVDLTNGGFSGAPVVTGIVPTGADVERTVESSVTADCPTGTYPDEVTVNLTVAILGIE